MSGGGNHRDLIGALYASASATGCGTCKARAASIHNAVADRNMVAHKAAVDERGKDWTEVIAEAVDEVASAVRFAEGHLDEPHTELERAAAAEKPASPTKPADEASVELVECPDCRQRTTLRKDGSLSRHRVRRGGRVCTRRWVKVTFELPPVKIPRAAAKTPDRKADGHCHTCERPVSGERLFCGPHLAKRESGVA